MRGLSHHRPWQLPAPQPHEEVSSLLRAMQTLAGRTLPPSEWLRQLHLHWPLNQGEGHEALQEALDALAYADHVGSIDLEAFSALAEEAMKEAWRGGIHEGHALISMLTPVEARLEHFDRVILAHMLDKQWPGQLRQNAWLNLTQQQALGLPSPEAESSLSAHDLLLLGSQPELLITWPLRAEGSPAMRSRYVERLAAYLAVHDMPESSYEAAHYRDWARTRDLAPYSPATPALPCPPAARRPVSVAVTRLKHLMTDPYYIYARDVLGLREMGEIDQEADGRERGILIHQAMAALNAHWNSQQRPADDDELTAIAEQTLADFSGNPEIILFWHQRLFRALQFVNQHEIERRTHTPQMKAEELVSQPIPLPAGKITLRGQIDRWEPSGQGAVIGDYKTGELPGAQEVQNGREPQLLAYALMLEAMGQPVAGAEHWQLPAGKKEGGIVAAPVDESLREALRSMLAQLMDPQTPLPARAVNDSKSERYENPYDGISRYDEWAS